MNALHWNSFLSFVLCLYFYQPVLLSIPHKGLVFWD